MSFQMLIHGRNPAAMTESAIYQKSGVSESGNS